ncbi:hypothetical protein GCM10020000_75530 [Streptomyces olivoverticillatus]
MPGEPGLAPQTPVEGAYVEALLAVDGGGVVVEERVGRRVVEAADAAEEPGDGREQHQAGAGAAVQRAAQAEDGGDLGVEHVVDVGGGERGEQAVAHRTDAVDDAVGLAEGGPAVVEDGRHAGAIGDVAGAVASASSGRLQFAEQGPDLLVLGRAADQQDRGPVAGGEVPGHFGPDAA